MTYRDSFLLWDERIELESYLPGYSDRYDLDQAFGDYYYYAANNSYYDELDYYLNQTMEVASPPHSPPPQRSTTDKDDPQKEEKKLTKSRRKVSTLIKQRYQFSGQRYLLLFTLERLSDPQNSDIVWVKQEDGIFEIRSPHKFAREWGAHKVKETKESKYGRDRKCKKGKKSIKDKKDKKEKKEIKERKEMTYEKMARSFRYYYKCNMITKVPGVRRYKWDMTVLEDLKKCCSKQPDL